MNDFERKLSQQPFRAPPPDLRAAIFGHAEVPARAAEPARWTWRDWFWPSPLAWGALAALWVIFAVIAMDGQPRPVTPDASPEWASSSHATLLSYHTAAGLNHVLDFTN